MNFETSRSALTTTPVFASVVALTTALGCGGVQADDRPFLRTTTAVVEDDDERVFEFSATHAAGKKRRSTNLQLGYSFSPTFSVEAELGFERDKIEDVASREQGLGVWTSWIDPAREGWGLATKLSVERERETGDTWSKPDWRAVMALSIPLADKTAWIHTNLGARYRADGGASDRWTSLWSLAGSKELSRHTALFAEVGGASHGSDRIAQIGVRQWILREKIALDVGVGRQFAHDTKSNFVAVSLSLYDLSY